MSSDTVFPDSLQSPISQPGNLHHSSQPQRMVHSPDLGSHQSLIQSINLLHSQLASWSSTPNAESAAKPRTPDVFDGSDPTAIDSFLFQCYLYFAARSGAFPDDSSRVAFALSYLVDAPLEWFQTELMRSVSVGGAYPLWFGSYPTFTDTLRRLFGPRDRVTCATVTLEALTCPHDSQVIRYTTDFNRHAYRTGWNDSALARQYYKGLPDRIKDELARIGKPIGLTPLQELASVIDQRYWERHSEVSNTSAGSRSLSGSPAASPIGSCVSLSPLDRSNSFSHLPSPVSSRSASRSHSPPSRSPSPSSPQFRSCSTSISSSSSTSSSSYLSARSCSASPDFPQDSSGS